MRWFRSNVDSTLTDFFAVRRRGCAGGRLERIGRVEQALRDCVEEAAERVLTAEELALLDAEQQLRPRGAAARVARPEALLFVLPIFLREEQWRPGDVEERQTQLHTTAALTRRLVATVDGADGSCAFHDIAAAMDEAARELRVRYPGGRPAGGRAHG